MLAHEGKSAIEVAATDERPNKEALPNHLPLTPPSRLPPHTFQGILTHSDRNSSEPASARDAPRVCSISMPLRNPDRSSSLDFFTFSIHFWLPFLPVCRDWGEQSGQSRQDGRCHDAKGGSHRGVQGELQLPGSGSLACRTRAWLPSGLRNPTSRSRYATAMV